MSVSVLSTTGRPVNLGDKSDNELAVMLDALDDQERQLREQRMFVTRELAKRMGDQTQLKTEEFDVTLRRYANVTRRARKHEPIKRGLLPHSDQGVVREQENREAGAA